MYRRHHSPILHPGETLKYTNISIYIYIYTAAATSEEEKQ